MKKIILFIYAVFATSVATAQLSSLIKGKVRDKETNHVFLCELRLGKLHMIDSNEIDETGSFSFEFTPEKATVYAVAWRKEDEFVGLERFYFKGNDLLNIELIEGGYLLDGANTKANEALFEWDKLIRDIRNMVTLSKNRMESDQFLIEVANLKSKLMPIFNTYKIGEKEFDTFFEKLIHNDLAYYSCAYFNGTGEAKVDENQVENFYSGFDTDRFLSADLLEFPYGVTFLEILMQRKFGKKSLIPLDEQLRVIPSEALKGQYVIGRMMSLNSSEDYKQMKLKYEHLFVMESQREWVEVIAKNMKDLQSSNAGEAAFPFSFSDHKGNLVNLSDFKGRLVLLDLWATWCGPCVSQEPEWAKLTEIYKSEDIAFVGISIDANKAKWNKHVAERDLKGIQLYAGTPNSISDAYKVSTIPRYILIDKKGNLITDNCPYPNNPKLKSLIDEWINK